MRPDGAVAALALAASLVAALGSRAHAQAVDLPQLDSVFAAYGPTGPGCSVGVSRDGQVVAARAYGLADLEHDVPSTPATIYEAGSLSKQVTAAAVTLLALDGKLSLDDDMRRWLPELPTYEAPITIRHLLTHTSGLRDWGNVAALGGWPRETRVYTNDLALDIARRQRALNYPPGQYYSYTNTGYNLLALIVGRVSGMTLAEFTRQRLFVPLGMTSTSWRDDFTRVVRGRAIAYEPAGGATYRQEMPFESAYGNGGLLTTPTDLLRWTANLEHGATVGGARFAQSMHQQATLASGRTITYASGLVVARYRGVREVSHSGSTAGYRAYLARYPDQGAAVAVLCNVANANATTLAHRVADLVLGAALAPRAASVPQRIDPARVAAVVGTYRSTRDGQPLRVAARGDGTITMPSAVALVLDPPSGATRVGLRTVSADGDTVRYVPVAPFAPGAAQLAAYAGTYASDEADGRFTVRVADGALQLADRYGRPLGTLTPAYADAFDGPGFDVFFTRDATGRVTTLVARDSRVWALRFARTMEPVSSTSPTSGSRP